MPETAISSALNRVRRRLRLQSIVWAVTIGSVAFAATLVVLVALVGVAVSWSVPLSMIGAVIAAWPQLQRANGIALRDAAGVIEQAGESFDNLLITASELLERPRPVRAEIREEILRQSALRLARVDLAPVASITRPLVILTAVTVGTAALTSTAWRNGFPAPAPLLDTVEASTHGIQSVAVTVTPPAYTKRAPETLSNPIQVTVIAGSRLRVEVVSRAEAITLEAAGQRPVQLSPGVDRHIIEWTAAANGSYTIVPVGSAREQTRFLSLVVIPDAAPTATITLPGRDLAMALPVKDVAISIEALDDIGLASVALQFTKGSGGGESFTFTDGQVPLTVERLDDRRWIARARWALADLGLVDGDVLVYRAIVRDRNPDGRPVQSEQYLLEFGRASSTATTGFALPEEERRYAISQQMVIYKTQQLIANQGQHRQDWLDQNRMIAIEQRMVRAEVVFLSGGEVEDEVEEASRSDEVVEGRLQNTGRAEMLRAINFMSRAEAQLNDGRPDRALVFEQQALKSLQIAFDRRRYFLRTMPDRSRIDPSRRLTGDAREARPWTRDRVEGTSRPLDSHRTVIRDLARATAAGTSAGADLAARVAGIDPSSTELRNAAVVLAQANTAESVGEAAFRAMDAVTAHALRALTAGSNLRLELDPLAGRVADELMTAKGRTP